MWVRSMLKEPEHHRQYWATMFGQFTWETKPDLDENGVPTEHAIPALKQLHQDLQVALPTHTGFLQATPNWQNLVLQHENDFEHVRSSFERYETKDKVAFLKEMFKHAAA